MEAVCTGSVFCFKGLNAPEGWIFCDGIPRPNDDGIYNKLIEEDIGTIDKDTNLYTPPNYDNTVVAKIDESQENILGLLSKMHEIYDEAKYIHAYITNGKIRNYNNQFIKRIYDVQKINKCNHRKQRMTNEFGVVDRRFVNDNKDEEEDDEDEGYNDSGDEYAIGENYNTFFTVKKDIMRWLIKI